MTTKQRTLEEILTRCAGAAVSCVICNGKGKFYKGDDGLTEPLTAICMVCNGTGRSYVLGGEVRLPCPWLPRDNPSAYVDYHAKSCSTCQGRAWVPNPDPYAWRRAVRAIDGAIVSDSSGTAVGDEVKVYVGNILRRVQMKEGLRDQLAEATAIERVLEQLPSVEIRSE